MWLTNLTMAEDPFEPALEMMLAALAAATGPVVVVSNELGQGIVPDNKLARAFRETQGRFNCAIAAQADLAVLITAGLPQVLKGKLP